MGGLAKLMPTTRWTYLIACLAISGIPVFSGFYSKDEILWKAFSNGNLLINGRVIWGLGAVGGDVHRLLHVPLLLHDLPRPRRPPRPHKHARTRVAAVHDLGAVSFSPPARC